MPHYSPTHSPDGTPRQPPAPYHGPKYGPDGSPNPDYPWPHTPQTEPSYTPKPEPPAFHNEHSCHMDGAFILLGGYVRIVDNETPEGTRGHELRLYIGGVGVGGMDCDGVLHINTGSWEEFYNRVVSFAYLALAPSFNVPASQLGHTALCFYDGSSNPLGYALPNVSIDIGLGGGTVEVKS